MRDDIKVAVIGKKGAGETSLLKKIAQNAVNIKTDVEKGIDVGYVVKDTKRIYLFGASGENRDALYRELSPVGIDLAVVVLDPTQGISNEDLQIIAELRDRNIPSILFMNKIDTSDEIPKITSEKEMIYGSARKGWGIERTLECILSTAYLHT